MPQRLRIRWAAPSTTSRPGCGLPGRLRGVQQNVIDGLSDLGNDSRANLDDARGDLAAGAYAAAKAKLSAILVRLDAAQQTIDEQTGIARAR